MTEYFVEKPMPQFGKDIYSCIPIPNDIVAKIRTDAIDEFLQKLKARNYKDWNYGTYEIMKEIAEKLKEQNNAD